jgi:hypothetical protein
MLAMDHSRVEDAVHQVGNEIHHDEDEGDDEESALRQRIIAVGDGIDQ